MSGRIRKQSLAAFMVAALTALAFWLSGTFDAFGTPFHTIAHADPKGIKYLGVGSCGGNGCHNQEIKANKKAADPEIAHDEMSRWERNDMHARAFADSVTKNKSRLKGLASTKSKEICEALKIPDATADTRCTVCHALSGFSNAESKSRILLNYKNDVPEAEEKSGKFKASHGVACDNCHGPSEKFLQPHSAKGWAQTQRTTAGMTGEKLFDQTGFYDTKNLKLRANLCVSCHLKIDPELISAGHPEPAFEMDSYCHSGWIHWRPQGAFSGAKVWAMGQIACMRESALQVAERIEAGAKTKPELLRASYQKLVSHVLMARHPAALIAPELDKLIATQFAAVNDNWADPKKAVEALHILGQTADVVSERLLTETFDKAKADSLASDVAAEGEVAGGKDYRAAFQYTYAMASLWETNFLQNEAPDLDRAELDKKIKDTPKSQKIALLFDEIYDAAKYNPASFQKVAKELMALFPGGVALAFPGKDPYAVAATPPPPADVKPPVADVKKPDAPPADVKPPVADTKKPDAPPADVKPPVADTKKPDAPPADVKPPVADTKKPDAPPADVKPPVADTKPPVADTKKPDAPSKFGAFIFCPNCGQKNKRENNFCLRCGIALPKVDE